MSENKTVVPMKGFRQPPQPTKGQVQQENATLGQELKQRLQNVQQFFGNMLQQNMRQLKNHDQEISSLSTWLAAQDTTEAAQKGDHILVDYAGVLLKEDGTPATIKVVDVEGKEVEVQDFFDGGNGSMFLLSNLCGGTLVPGFEEQLVGLKAGEGKEIEVQFPKGYNPESLSEKKAKFYVFVHLVKRPYATSPVGALIEQNTRIRQEAQAKALAEAQALQAAAKAAAEAPTSAETSATPAAETPQAPEATPEVAPETSAETTAPQS